MMPKKRLGIFGFGYTAQAFVNGLNTNKYDVWGTSRMPSNKMHDKVNIIDFNGNTIKELISTSDVILSCIPPNQLGSDPVLAEYTDLIQSNKKLDWVGYLSATSVYGNHHGQWVDETSDNLELTTTGMHRLAAEKQWQFLYNRYQVPIVIFRLAGIYGPGRSALDRVKRSDYVSIEKKGHKFSRIHVDDIAQALNLSLHTPTPGQIFNVADDVPIETPVVDAYAAELLELAIPVSQPFDGAQLSERRREFYQGNRLICNQKIKKALKFKLQFPSYKEGLADILKNVSVNG